MPIDTLFFPHYWLELNEKIISYCEHRQNLVIIKEGLLVASLLSMIYQFREHKRLSKLD